MSILIAFLFGILGVIIGSFLGVVVDRLNTGMSLGGRSMCLSCRHTLRWFELIPVVSFILQRGRCRICKSAIPKQVFLIESVTGLVFFTLALRFISQIGFSSNLWVTIGVFGIIFSLLIAISFYDLKHTIVPDVFVYPFLIITIVLLFFMTPRLSFELHSFVWPNFWDIASGFLIPLPFFLLWLFSRGRLMGFGDIKLMAGIGWLAGLYFGIASIILAFWGGALISLGIIAVDKIIRLFRKRKRFILSSEIPFAPFLVLGLYLVIIFRINILALPFF